MYIMVIFLGGEDQLPLAASYDFICCKFPCNETKVTMLNTIL